MNWLWAFIRFEFSLVRKSQLLRFQQICMKLCGVADVERVLPQWETRTLLSVVNVYPSNGPMYTTAETKLKWLSLSFRLSVEIKRNFFVAFGT